MVRYLSVIGITLVLGLTEPVYFCSFFQFSVRELHNWAVYLHIIGGGEGKVFGQREVRKQFLIHNMQNNFS